MAYRTIGMIGAMEEEIRLLSDKMTQVRSHRAAGTVYVEGTLGANKVVLCKSGVGKVNAAVCTQVLIDRFQADAVLFTGVAGALDPDLDVGDIVVSRDCMQHDMDVTPLGFERGTIPYQDVSVFPADRALVKAALQASAAVVGSRTVEGRVLSGDQFIADRDTVRWLYEKLGGTCVEMEGAAVAQVCHMNDIPYVVVRSMSDKADGSAPDSFEQFTRLASERSARMVEAMLKTISQQNTGSR